MNLRFGTLILIFAASRAWSADTTWYLPHYTLRDGLWETQVSLRNTSDSAQYIRIFARDDDGTLVGETGWNIGPDGGVVLPVDELVPGLATEVGWLEFRSTGDFFQGLMVFSFLPTGGSSSLPLVTDATRKTVLPLLENTDAWQSGFALTNVSGSAARVHLQLLGFANEPVRERDLILPGHCKLVQMLSDTFDGTLPQQSSLVITASEPVVAFALTFASDQSQIVAVPASPAPAEPELSRTFLTVADLYAEDHVPGTPIDLRYFAAMGSVQPARHTFSGQLVIPETTIHSDNVFDDLKFFPGFECAFFSHGDELVPVERGIMDSTGDASFWQIILSPGKIWLEPADGGYSRGAFPFIWTNPYTNRGHYGVATFVYDDATISKVCIQVSQENATWSIYDYWGLIPATYQPGMIADEAQHRQAFIDELSFQREIFPFDALESAYGDDATSHFLDGSEPERVSAACIIKDDVIYLQPMMTRHGAFPYPRYQRFGVFSWAKSMAASVAALRLAQKYGPEILDLRIADYVDVTATHDGWRDVTFRDCLNMATGVGEYAPDPNASGWAALADDEGPLMDQFIDAPTTQGKLDACFSFGNYDWGPGEHLRYGSFNTFVLSVAMDRYLKSQEGDQARLWDMVVNEVYRPIGLTHAPMQHSLDDNGQRDIPIMAWGIFPTVDDIAKVVDLFRNGGTYDGEQLIHPELTAQATCRTEEIGLPVLDSDSGAGPVTYQLGFWSLAADLGDGNGPFRIPTMLGYGGNWLLMFPNGTTSFRIQDDFNMELNGMAEVALTLEE